MSLEVKSYKKYIPKIIWGIIILLIAGFLIRVSIWEYNYYKEKEGSERAVAPTVGAVTNEEPEIDETPVTEEQVREWTVAADKPRYLTIEKLGIYNHRTVEVGTTTAGQLAVPNNLSDIGWYSQSAKPGTGGVSVFDGHSGGYNDLGVFSHLSKLAAGDIITITMGDGTVYNYRVYDNVTVPLDQADAYMPKAFTKVDGQETITIISCTGEWSQVQQTSLDRQFLRASKI